MYKFIGIGTLDKIKSYFQDHNHLQKTLSVLNVGRTFIILPTHVPDVAFHAVILIAVRESCTGKKRMYT